MEALLSVVAAIFKRRLLIKCNIERKLGEQSSIEF
jgi:hypothetical protein